MDSDLDRVLADHYLSNLADRPIGELRSLRVECRSLETRLSYLRRLVQGRHDIVTGETARRASGGDPADVHSLVARLPEILAARTRSSGPGRRPSSVEPSDLSGRLVGRLEAISDAVHLENPSAMSDVDLEATAEQLAELEGEVSAFRHAMFERIDVLEAEITRRYADGEARVDDLLTRNPN